MALPRPVWDHIYSYDSTYRDTFSSVLDELSAVNTFWYLEFLHQRSMTCTKMRQTQAEAATLERFWNTRFRQQPYLSEETRRSWGDPVCRPTHLTDTAPWTPLWPRLLANIESYRIMNE